MESEDEFDLLAAKIDDKIAGRKQSHPQKRRTGSDVADALTQETLLAIFLHLSPTELVSAMLVCKTWYSHISSSPWLWKQLYLRRWRLSQYEFVASMVDDILRSPPTQSPSSSARTRTSPATASYAGQSSLPWRERYTRRHTAESNFMAAACTSRSTSAHPMAVLSLQVWRGWAITGGQDGAVKVWDLDSLSRPGARRQFLLDGHLEPVWGVDCNDQFIVSGSGDRRIGVWQTPNSDSVASSGILSPVCWLRAHSAEIWAVRLDGSRLLSTSVDGFAKLWDLRTQTVMSTLCHVTSGCSATLAQPSCMDMCSSVFDCFLDGTTAFTAGGDNRLLQWDLRAPNAPVRKFLGHDDFIFSIACAPGAGLLATASGDKTLRLWDPTSAREMQLLVHSDSVWCCATDGNARLVSTGVDSRLRLWSVQRERRVSKVASLICHVGAVTRCALSETAVVTCGVDGNVCVTSFA